MKVTTPVGIMVVFELIIGVGIGFLYATTVSPSLLFRLNSYLTCHLVHRTGTVRCVSECGGDIFAYILPDVLAGLGYSHHRHHSPRRTPPPSALECPRRLALRRANRVHDHPADLFHAATIAAGGTASLPEEHAFGMDRHGSDLCDRIAQLFRNARFTAAEYDRQELGN